jgi:hypothetical protein
MSDIVQELRREIAVLETNRNANPQTIQKLKAAANEIEHLRLEILRLELREVSGG